MNKTSSNDQLLANLHRRQQRQEQRLQLIATIPAKELTVFLEQENEYAVTKIQAFWRGYSTRKCFAEQKIQLKKEKAAIKIQKVWRKYLNLKYLETIENDYHSSTYLSSDDISEFQHEIDDWCNNHKVNVMNSEQLKKLEDEVQDLLILYYKDFHKDKSSKRIQDDLILQLDNYIQILSNLSSCTEVTAIEIQKFLIKNKQHQQKGKEYHLKALKQQEQPWKKIFATKQI